MEIYRSESDQKIVLAQNTAIVVNDTMLFNDGDISGSTVPTPHINWFCAHQGCIRVKPNPIAQSVPLRT